MVFYDLNYTVSIDDMASQGLKVNLTIPTIHPQTLEFFKGKLRFTSFVCNAPYVEHTDRYAITISESPFTLTYTLTLGHGGKHGLQGGVTPDLICFSGDQVFLFPIDLLVSKNLTPSSSIGRVQITLDCSDDFHITLPFGTIGASNPHTYCQSPAWHQAYELMKSAYTAGKLIPFKTSEQQLKIYAPLDYANFDSETLYDIESLYHYYSQLFEIADHPLTLILLPSVPQRLGGCGTHIICSSFDPNNPRDWQLLSHRMFHSFMDTYLPLSDFHIPSQLWLTEGLATYFENASLDMLTDTRKDVHHLESTREFCRLFTRYLYSKLKPHSPFDFAPMSEKYIRSMGLLEFLHYTHAPLVIYYIKAHYCQSPSDLIKALRASVTHHTFSIEAFFKQLLGTDIDSFAPQYLFGNAILPLWNLKVTDILAPHALIEDLNDFEYLLYSWLSHELPGYHQVQIPKTLLTLQLITTLDSDSYLAPTHAQALQKYSPALYHIMNQLFSAY
ncbi:MAG: hypothetical protein ACRCW2_10675 [Cellulosilyticaceae bacterium]